MSGQWEKKLVDHLAIYGDISESMSCQVQSESLFAKSLVVIHEILKMNERSLPISLQLFSSFVMELVPKTRDLNFIAKTFKNLATIKLVGPTHLNEVLTSIDRHPQEVAIVISDGLFPKETNFWNFKNIQMKKRVIFVTLKNPCAKGPRVSLGPFADKEIVLNSGPINGSESALILEKLSESLEMTTIPVENRRVAWIFFIILYYILELFIENKLAK